jgi:hypothetical protein
MRAARFLLIIGALLLPSGCGGSPKSVTGIESGGSNSASCAALSPAQKMKHANLVFDGKLLRGPTARFGSSTVLTSPARVEVSRYLKGHGPKVVRIQTAVTRHGSEATVSEDGIQARAGEHWRIFTDGRTQPFSTSMCGGSHRLKSRA